MTDATSGSAIVDEARSLVRAAADQGVTLRLLGGTAVAVRCEHSTPIPHREFADIDAITRRKHVKSLVGVLEARGYEPNQRFNALNWRERLIFYGRQGKLDVFVESFELCHRIELGDRLEIDKETISASDLLLTKLQVVEMTAKDLDDSARLLCSHGIDSEGPSLDAGYLSAVLASDWGLWRTVTYNLEKVAELGGDAQVRVASLQGRISAAPKSRRWKSRAVVGERKRWYELPEEVG